MPAVTFPTDERHRPSAGTKLYCLLTEAHACEQLDQGCYVEANQQQFKLATFRVVTERSTVTPHMPRPRYMNINRKKTAYSLTDVVYCNTRG